MVKKKKKYSPIPIISKEQCILILKEFVARHGKLNIYDGCFDKQLDFINDPARLKAALTGRRAGKTEMVVLMLCATALKYPDCNVGYIHKTLGEARRTIQQKFKKIDKQYKLGATWNQTEHVYRFPNGSSVWVLGADSTSSDKDKIRGQAYRLLCLDECAFWTNDVRELVYEVCYPTLKDHLGSFVLISTPGVLKSEKANDGSGFFYSITEGFEKGWSVHRWLATDNPYICSQEKIELEEEFKRNPNFDQTPKYKREHMAQWVKLNDELVYKYNSKYNTIDKLPGKLEDYHFILGLDWGSQDATAMVVGAYNYTECCLYIVDCYKKTKMLISDVEKQLEEFVKKYPIRQFITDHNPQVTGDLQKKFSTIKLEPAKKSDKLFNIQLMNDDFITAKIKLCNNMWRHGDEERGVQLLADEWDNLIWDPNAAIPTEYSGCQNHLADACLYLWRKSNHHLNKEKAPNIPKTIEEELKEYWLSQMELNKKTSDPFSFMHEDWSSTDESWN